MQEELIELLPCANCKGRAYWYGLEAESPHDGMMRKKHIYCGKCKNRTASVFAKDIAISAWNNRPVVDDNLVRETRIHAKLLRSKKGWANSLAVHGDSVANDFEVAAKILDGFANIYEAIQPQPPSGDVVERVARVIFESHYSISWDIASKRVLNEKLYAEAYQCREDAKAALSAIPSMTMKCKNCSSHDLYFFDPIRKALADKKGQIHTLKADVRITPEGAVDLFGIKIEPSMTMEDLLSIILISWEAQKENLSPLTRWLAQDALEALHKAGVLNMRGE